MNNNDKLEKYLYPNRPETMKGFLKSINIQIDTEEACYTIDSINDFITQLEKLDRNSRKILADIIKLCKVRIGTFNSREVKIRTIEETLDYDKDELVPLIKKLESKKMCYLEYDDYEPFIILTGIKDYENFFYDLKNYCSYKNVHFDKMLVDLKFDLLD